MSEILNSCLFPTGTKLTLTDRTRSKTLLPFSICFAGQPLEQSSTSPNAVFHTVLTTRVGKSGKDRLTTMRVATTVFPIEFEKRKVADGAVDYYNVVELRAVPRNPKEVNVLNFSFLDFLGWATSKISALVNLSLNIPLSKEIRRYMKEYESGLKVSDLSRQLRDDPEMEKIYSGDGVRKDRVSLIREWEAGLAYFLFREKKQKLEIMLRALAYLIWTNLKNNNDLYDEKLLYNSYDYYRNEYGFLNSLKTKDKKSKAASLETLLSLQEFFLGPSKGNPFFHGAVFNNNPIDGAHKSWKIFEDQEA